ncbi:MAG: ABC transporter permease [Gemmataceae bacterium]
MIRALMWKEYREHRSIWLALAVVSGGGLYGLSRFMESIWGRNYNGAHDTLRSVAVLFAWTYGLVCGAMLLANENETGTLTFLDLLPARRLELWLVKCLFGLLLLLAQVAVLIGFVVGLGITETTAQLLETLLAMVFFGLFSLSWGLLFSARGDYVLNVIGLAFVGQIAAVLLASVLFGFVFVLVSGFWGEVSEFTRMVLFGLCAFGMTAAPAIGSARLFARLDRERRLRRPLRARPPETLVDGASWRRLLWLSYVQMRRMLAILSVLALGLGCALPAMGPAGWPVLTLLLGALCGVSVWHDEQMSAAFRSLGDQRFPLGRIWIVKVGMRFALAVFAALLLLLPSLVLVVSHRVEEPLSSQRVPIFADLLHSSLVGPIVPVETHLSMWLLYGFASGQLCGMLFRKSLVAGVVALGSAATLVCLWLPSLVGIGLHFWQVAAAPLALLVAGWLLMPAWTADRLLSRDPLMRLGSALLATVLGVVGGLWYRVAEIPDVHEPFDMLEFSAGIPPLDPDKNRGGMDIRGAWVGVEQMMRELFVKREKEPRVEPVQLFQKENSFLQEVQDIYAKPEGGWPNRPSDLGDWLDKQFEKEWYCGVLAAAYCPVGVVEDARQLTFDLSFSSGRQWNYLTFLNMVLAVRGLQRQARGDHWTFANNLRISLALSRELQHRAPPTVANAGRHGEMIVVSALDRWLSALPNYPDLLESVRDILLEHEARLPDYRDADKVSYLIARNSLMEVPEKLVMEHLLQTARHEHVDFHNERFDRLRTEINAAALLWRIPWEQERHERILRLVFQGDPQRPDLIRQRQAEKWGGYSLTELRKPGPGPRGKRDLASLHAAQLKAALRLYQAKNIGMLPATLDDLIPHYLPAVPLDPFDGKPFRYRISKGEELHWFDEARTRQHPAIVFKKPLRPLMAADPGFNFIVKIVPPGQAILWSAGEDEQDDGGLHHQGFGAAPMNSNTDLIYLVPLPPP